MSDKWIEAVERTNRFASGGEEHWKMVAETEMTTLDKLIEKFGVPSFVKIDVEGYEYEVLCGLSQRVSALSFEFTPERLEEAALCMARCAALGMSELAVSYGESFDLSNWSTASQTFAWLEKFDGDNVAYGDVYAR